MRNPKQFVRLRQPGDVLAKHQGEFNSALRELSATGVYKVKHMELNDDGKFFYLEGGKSPYSAYLFENV